jgi:TolB-like protein/DNA-binding winged helix-turn-helix (wHTH) protein/tetratricopeptide (TPR) repeat protein
MSGFSKEHKTYEFDAFSLNVGSRTLTENGAEIRLAHRPFEVLAYLVANNDRVVGRNELLDKFWQGRDVYDDALRKCVGSIRKALNDLEKPGRFIETRYGDGYRFVADLKLLPTNGNGHYNGNKAAHSSGAPEPAVLALASGSRRFASMAVFAVIIISIGLGVYLLTGWSGQASSASTVNAPTQIKTIAVMPLKNLTGDPRNEYFSDGVTESIITQLSRVNELKVVSRSSTFAFKDKHLDPREIGQVLGVEALLEGGVQKAGDNVNIRVRLVSTKDGSVIWTSNDFERPIGGASDLQDMIACNVAVELRTKLCGGPGDRRTGSGQAYQEYLKGRYEWNKRSPDGIKQSITHYIKAVEYDPRYALAYAGLADSYIQGIWHVPFVESEVVPKARESAVTALRLDENLAEAHAAFASVLSMEWNWAEAERELDRAIALDPGYARAHHVRAFSLMLKGRYAESIAAIDRASELDPVNLVIQTDRGNLLFAAERIEEAFAQWERTLDRDPNFVMAREHRATAYEITGNEQAAIADLAIIRKAQGRSEKTIAVFRDLAEKKGLIEVRRRELKEMLLKDSRGEHVSPISIAYHGSLVRQPEICFKYLEKAFMMRDSQIVLLASPQFWAIRQDLRYADLMARIGLRDS